MPGEHSSELPSQRPERLYQHEQAREELNTFLKGRGRRIIPIKNSAISDLANIDYHQAEIDLLKSRGVDENDPRIINQSTALKIVTDESEERKETNPAYVRALKNAQRVYDIYKEQTQSENPNITDKNQITIDAYLALIIDLNQ